MMNFLWPSSSAMPCRSLAASMCMNRFCWLSNLNSRLNSHNRQMLATETFVDAFTGQPLGEVLQPLRSRLIGPQTFHSQRQSVKP
mmetsp:Transcript_29860/g.47893  ORF Transcript_29860/g.47893 Transcript_29860/m.47893 type:complete len:85 (+) Transcript_29860:437-691(+)